MSVLMETYVTPFLQSIVDHHDFEKVTEWSINNHWLPISSVTVYVLFVFLMPLVMKNRKPLKLRALNSIWNLALALFSFVGAYYTWPRMIEMITSPDIRDLDPSRGNLLSDYKNMLSNPNTWSTAMRRNTITRPDGTFGIKGSFDASVCIYRDDFYRRGVVGLMTELFMFSKYFELFDTVLLVLQKKKVIFLHWYHHITVLLYCVYCWETVGSGGVWFATVNFTVHSVMYFYYFLASINCRRIIAPIASFITTFQISQMMMGSYIAFYVYYHYHYGKGCDATDTHSLATILMYVSYLILFLNFFVHRFILKAPRKAGSDGKKPKAA